MSKDESSARAVVPGEMEQAQTSCRKRTKAGYGLTWGLFTTGCAFCLVQLNFSVMREHKGPSN